MIARRGVPEQEWEAFSKRCFYLDQDEGPVALGKAAAYDVLEAYEHLIDDAMVGDHTLFSSAEGIESLWERFDPLLRNPPPVRPYQPGSWGPNPIHQLIAPDAWRLPFERAWRAS